MCFEAAMKMQVDCLFLHVHGQEGAVGVSISKFGEKIELVRSCWLAWGRLVGSSFEAWPSWASHCTTHTVSLGRNLGGLRVPHERAGIARAAVGQQLPCESRDNLRQFRQLLCAPKLALNSVVHIHAPGTPRSDPV